MQSHGCLFVPHSHSSGRQGGGLEGNTTLKLLLEADVYILLSTDQNDSSSASKQQEERASKCAYGKGHVMMMPAVQRSLSADKALPVMCWHLWLFCPPTAVGGWIHHELRVGL